MDGGLAQPHLSPLPYLRFLQGTYILPVKIPNSILKTLTLKKGEIDI